jgi:hypothetical protein
MVVHTRSHSVQSPGPTGDIAVILCPHIARISVLSDKKTITIPQDYCEQL